MAKTLTLKLGTRGSMLARIQSQHIADKLEKLHPHVAVELVIIRTSGDQITDRPLHDLGGKGLFIREIEQALLDGSVDFAVHSFKDVPVTMPLVAQENLLIAAVPPREDVRDVLALAPSMAVPGATGIDAIPLESRIASGSLRRRAQLLALRPDLRIEGIRGNIDTRLRKLAAGEWDGIILAMAGLKRAGLFDSAFMTPLEPAQMVPSAGQGALALQCRRDNAALAQLLAPLHHPPTAACVEAERAIVRGLDGDCTSPIGALATVQGDALRLLAAVGRRGGDGPVLHAAAESPLDRPQAAIEAVLGDLAAQNVREHLHG